ncbi:type I glyceraldehyde-3-phosphate dehydrogenase [Desulfovibrio litoralis]|uniref:Glyceraldehyde-3-phosphate dehydrogenase n=1 Tax=Desulfovibrio litoralis DSM 11393 TaxID=1121455 RepID=A0A1M7SXE4_9BACT|nr:type I glyceraldehyde-3-phosphate dehydrogenase [Desulfovibrio litoralis]SHN63152.1 glyceraldehyde-3-phosphate dehydrogenase (NAD+) [Desulfovibrio litoralis DSM 11393]
MATIKLGLNGFGRIGRYLLRLLATDNDLEIVALNARADNAALAHLFKYDSVHRTFNGEVSFDNKGIIVNGHHIAVTRFSPGEWKWSDYGVDIAVETTGTIKDKNGLMKHINCGVKKTVISAPAKDADVTIVMGVNDKEYNAKEHNVISAASCTTNCLAPIAKILHDNFVIKHGLMTTIHSYTMSQRILDGSHKDWRRARAAAVSMIPTTTGAAKAVSSVIPDLKGKIDGMAIRVPTPDVSLVDFTCELEKPTTAEELNNTIKQAIANGLQENYAISYEPLVSCDYIGASYAGIVDAECTSVINGTMAKVIVWYDNETSFTYQLLRLLRMVGKSL